MRSGGLRSLKEKARNARMAKLLADFEVAVQSLKTASTDTAKKKAVAKAQKCIRKIEDGIAETKDEADTAETKDSKFAKYEKAKEQYEQLRAPARNERRDSIVEDLLNPQPADDDTLSSSVEVVILPEEYITDAIEDFKSIQEQVKALNSKIIDQAISLDEAYEKYAELAGQAEEIRAVNGEFIDAEDIDQLLKNQYLSADINTNHACTSLKKTLDVLKNAADEQQTQKHGEGLQNIIAALEKDAPELYAILKKHDKTDINGLDKNEQDALKTCINNIRIAGDAKSIAYELRDIGITNNSEKYAEAIFSEQMVNQNALERLDELEKQLIELTATLEKHDTEQLSLHTFIDAHKQYLKITNQKDKIMDSWIEGRNKAHDQSLDVYENAIAINSAKFSDVFIKQQNILRDKIGQKPYVNKDEESGLFDEILKEIHKPKNPSDDSAEDDEELTQYQEEMEEYAPALFGLLFDLHDDIHILPDDTDPSIQLIERIYAIQPKPHESNEEKAKNISAIKKLLKEYIELTNFDDIENGNNDVKSQFIAALDNEKLLVDIYTENQDLKNARQETKRDRIPEDEVLDLDFMNSDEPKQTEDASLKTGKNSDDKGKEDDVTNKTDKELLDITKVAEELLSETRGMLRDIENKNAVDIAETLSRADKIGNQTVELIKQISQIKDSASEKPSQTLLKSAHEIVSDKLLPEITKAVARLNTINPEKKRSEQDNGNAKPDEMIPLTGSVNTKDNKSTATLSQAASKGQVPIEKRLTREQAIKRVQFLINSIMSSMNRRNTDIINNRDHKDFLNEKRNFKEIGESAAQAEALINTYALTDTEVFTTEVFPQIQTYGSVPRFKDMYEQKVATSGQIYRRMERLEQAKSQNNITRKEPTQENPKPQTNKQRREAEVKSKQAENSAAKPPFATPLGRNGKPITLNARATGPTTFNRDEITSPPPPQPKRAQSQNLDRKTTQHEKNALENLARCINLTQDKNKISTEVVTDQNENHAAHLEIKSNSSAVIDILKTALANLGIKSEHTEATANTHVLIISNPNPAICLDQFLKLNLDVAYGKAANEYLAQQKATGANTSINSDSNNEPPKPTRPPPRLPKNNNPDPKQDELEDVLADLNKIAADLDSDENKYLAQQQQQPPGGGDSGAGVQQQQQPQQPPPGVVQQQQHIDTEPYFFAHTEQEYLEGKEKVQDIHDNFNKREHMADRAVKAAQSVVKSSTMPPEKHNELIKNIDQQLHEMQLYKSFLEDFARRFDPNNANKPDKYGKLRVDDTVKNPPGGQNTLAGTQVRIAKIDACIAKLTQARKAIVDHQKNIADKTATQDIAYYAKENAENPYHTNNKNEAYEYAREYLSIHNAAQRRTPAPTTRVGPGATYAFNTPDCQFRTTCTKVETKTIFGKTEKLPAAIVQAINPEKTFSRQELIMSKGDLAKLDKLPLSAKEQLIKRKEQLEFVVTMIESAMAAISTNGPVTLDYWPKNLQTAAAVYCEKMGYDLYPTSIQNKLSTKEKEAYNTAYDQLTSGTTKNTKFAEVVETAKDRNAIKEGKSPGMRP